MTDICLTRRDMLRVGIACTGAFAARSVAAGPPAAEVLETRVISPQPALYCGWPTLTRQKSGRLWLVWSGGREAHVCPFGRVEAMTSDDGGQTWSWPRVLLDGAIDDRDAGVLETAQGSLLVTTFSSLAFEAALTKAETAGTWPAEQVRRWQAARERLTPEQRRAELGTWMLRSTDGGTTWSAAYRVPVNSPHGPVQLADGRVLYAGKQLWHDNTKNGVAISEDDGRTWTWLAEIPTRPGDDPQQYHELHAVEAADRTLIAHIRNHNATYEHETLQSESRDGGRIWSVPRSIGVWGYPSHLLRLRDGGLLMSYGHRRAPIGNQARLSRDNGTSWSEPILLSDDGTSTDLGYPSTVQLDDGTLVTVWYERLNEYPLAVLRQARWRLIT